MSILAQLKRISAGQAAQLYTRHPLHADDHETRLRYLGAVALACAPERAPSEQERRAFLALGDSMGLASHEAAEQLDERASVQEEDIRRLFGLIRERNLRWLYVLDVSWLHLADGQPDAGEAEMLNEVAGLLDLDRAKLAALGRLLAALRDRQPRVLAQELPAWGKDPELARHLPFLVKRCFPFAGLVQDRWIDHGDGSTTDVRSGLRWQRGPVFAADEHPDRPNVLTVRFQGEAEGVVEAFPVDACQEIKAGQLLVRIASAAGPVEVRADGAGTVMEFLARVGDVVRPGAELLSLSMAGGPGLMSRSLPEDGKPSASDLHQVRMALARANLVQPPPGMSPWRLPTRNEFQKVIVQDIGLGSIAGMMFKAGGLVVAAPGASVFAAVRERQLWCRRGAADHGELALGQLDVYNPRSERAVFLVLCRDPLSEGAAQ